MEVISQKSSLERQRSSISGSELRLGLFFWRAAAGALLFIYLFHLLAAAATAASCAGGRGLMRGKCLAVRAAPFFMRVLEKRPVSVWRECRRTSKWASRSISPHTDGVLGVVTASLPRCGITSYRAFFKVEESVRSE